MKCPKCNTENGIYAYRCSKCGSELSGSSTQRKTFSSNSGQTSQPKVHQTRNIDKQNKKTANQKPSNVQSKTAPKEEKASIGALIVFLIINIFIFFYLSYYSFFSLFCFYYGIKALIAYSKKNEYRFKKYYKKTKILFVIAIFFGLLIRLIIYFSIG